MTDELITNEIKLIYPDTTSSELEQIIDLVYYYTDTYDLNISAAISEAASIILKL